MKIKMVKFRQQVDTAYTPSGFFCVFSLLRQALYNFSCATWRSLETNKITVRPAQLIFTCCLIILVISFTIILPKTVQAKEAELHNLVVTNSSTDLLLFLKLENAFTPELLNGLQNGLPITFSYNITLEMVRSGWLDKEIYSGSVDHTLIYDNLKKEYSVLLDEKTNKFTTAKLADAQKRMVELNGLRIVPLKELEPDRQYILKARVVLDKKNLPFNFNYLIPFSFWDLETDWYSVEFRY